MVLLFIAAPVTWEIMYSQKAAASGEAAAEKRRSGKIKRGEHIAGAFFPRSSGDLEGKRLLLKKRARKIKIRERGDPWGEKEKKGKAVVCHNSEKKVRGTRREHAIMAAKRSKRGLQRRREETSS